MSWTKITADDVQRVAKECFVPEKRTVAYLVAPKQPRRRRPMRDRLSGSLVEHDLP